MQRPGSDGRLSVDLSNRAPRPQRAAAGRLEPPGRGHANGRNRAGFRMPARRERRTRSEGGRPPKASEERTRRGRWAVYRLCGFDEAEVWVGDALAGVVGNGLTIAVGSLSPRRRSTRRFGMIDGVVRDCGAAGATAMQRRKQGFPAGGWCDEAMTGVMASGS
jgi:hypothetical protein